MVATLDHLAIFAPDLRTGVAYVQDTLGVTPVKGGTHPQMGTHNELLRLGDDMFLEIIAINPEVAAPSSYRPWFDLGDAELTARHWHAGIRLRGMVARTANVQQALERGGPELGHPLRVSRGLREWTFAIRQDGRLPGGGTLPHIMDWETQGPAGPTLPASGCRLLEVVLETPRDHATIEGTYVALGLERAPRLKRGPETRLFAAIETPNGVRILG